MWSCRRLPAGAWWRGPVVGLALLLWSSLAAATAYVHESWSVADGLPINSISQIAQSRDGYFWLATFDGLVRFDGARFVVFNSSNTPGFNNNRLHRVSELADGRLLLGSEGGLLQLFDPVTRTCREVVRVDRDAAPLTWLDAAGTTWVGLEPGLGRLTDGRVEPLTDPGLASMRVSALAFGADRRISIAAVDAGIWALTETGLTQRAAPGQLGIGRIDALFEAADGTLWAGGERGVVAVDATGAHRLRDGERDWPITVQWIASEADGTVLIGSEIGPQRVVDGRLQPIDVRDRRRTGALPPTTDGGWRISASTVFRDGRELFRLDDRVATSFNFALGDRQGSLWLATTGAGLHRLRPVVFSVLSVDQGLSAREVYPLHESADDAVWIGTQKGGLNRFADGEFSVFGQAAGLTDDNIRALASDRDGTLWVATQERGLFHRDRSGAFIREEEPGLATAHVRALFEDRVGRLWAGADTGLWLRDAGGAWTRHPASAALAGCTVRVMREAPDGALWLGTDRCGVARLPAAPGGDLQRFSAADGSLSDFVRDLYVVDAYSVWIASEDRGLSRLRRSSNGTRTVAVRAANGLLSDGIHTLLADGKGWLWMSSNQGISRVRQRDLDALADRLEQTQTGGPAAPMLAIESYAESSGLRNREANGGFQSTAIRTRDGRLWFATQDGVAIVDPDSALLARPVQPAIEAVVSGKRAFRVDSALDLDADARSFRVEYTELEQFDAAQVRFRYRLDGYDDWVDAGTRRVAYFTKVPPGNYEFQLQAWAGGDWDGDIARLKLSVRPYFYETSAFTALLFLAVVALLAAAYRARVGWLNSQRRELTHQVAIRTQQLAAGKEAAEQAARVIAEQADQLRANDRQKSRFFDDLAHELRTPLTLILGPLKDSRRKGTDAPALVVDGAIRNSEVLLDLTNQLLDLARLEGGKLELALRREDLTAMLRASAERFAPLAAMRGVGFRWRAPELPLMVLLDTRHASKIVDNLLSNAFKFTPAGGRVELSARVEAAEVRVEVSDSGPGISAEHLPHVFERFYQAESAGERLQPGTGIGLALVHDLTTLHRGRLEVRSGPAGGTTFAVLLPLIEPNIRKSEIAIDLATAAMPVDSADTQDGDEEDRTTILVVDDHAEIRALLRGYLAPAYRVIEASDGRAALALARERLPDLIVADISMPVLDGYGLCAAVRGDPEIDWLPIILLTARAGLSDRLEGLKATADDYLTKPFEAPELLTRIDNLIAQRRRLQQRFAQGLGAPDAVVEADSAERLRATPALDDEDAGYRKRLLATIATHMSNETFKVADLAKAMCQDRTQVFRRVRELTGQAPSDLLRDLRLERAAELLQADEGQVSDIAYACGFSSVAYFIKCFRERYGRTPGQCRGMAVRPAAVA